MIAGAPLGIEVRNVVRSFGRHRVLRGVTAHFPAGAVTAVVGSNGCGKSTLLRILAGLMDFERGQIVFDGREVPPRGGIPWSVRRRIGLLGHASFAYPELTGRENLQLYASLYDVPSAKVEGALERYGLSGPASDRQVGAYSRGMTQRIALCRVWLQEPSFLLLDEPMTGLDDATRAQVLGDLREAAAEGRTVVVVSHDPRDLSELDARVQRMVVGVLHPEEPEPGPEPRPAGAPEGSPCA